MVKTIHRIFAVAMALCLCVTVFPSVAFAAEDGFATTTSSVTDTVTDENGNTIITVTVEKQTQGTTEDGVTVDRKETVTDITTSDADGKVLSISYREDGTERREWEQEVAPGEEMSGVDVELKPGEATSGSSVQTTTQITGDERQGSDDEEYDFTATIAVVERSVEAESSRMETVMKKAETDIESVRAEEYEGKDPNVFGPVLDFVGDAAAAVPKPSEEGYDYQLTGYGDATNELKVLRDYITYKKVDGKPVKDENGNYIIEKIETKVDNTPMQIALRKDENGEYEYFFGYCIDSDTEAQDGAWYKVSNLHDNDYYPDPAAAGMLRAVVTNGYWGTKEGMGSIAQIKALIRQACGEDAVITVDTDDKGGRATYKIADIIEGLTESEALAATQAAIWSFANGDSNTRDGKDGYIAHGPVNVYKPNPNRNAYVREYIPESDARAMAVFNWLRSLEPIADTADDVDTVINGQNSIDNISLTVGSKVKDHADNMDENDDNDVYGADLNFSLAIVPDPEKDDLLVYLLDGEGNPIKDKDGNHVVKRLAGKNSEGRVADTIQPDENGVYTLKNLQLSENSDFKFDLHLEGAQYLNKGVYIYTAHGGSDKSQSVVGIAEGTQTVDVSVGMTIRFDAQETKRVTAERTWHNEKYTQSIPSAPPSANTGHPVTDGEIQLARPVKTGDTSGVLLGVAAAGILGLAVICLSGYRPKEN